MIAIKLMRIVVVSFLQSPAIIQAVERAAAVSPHSTAVNCGAYTFGVFEIIGLIIAQIFLLALGGALGAICASFVFFATRSVADARGKRVARRTAFLFPLIAVFYLESGAVIHDLARLAAGKDSILDGVYHYPLGNGYNLTFFDEAGPKGGWIDDPRGGSLPVDRIYGLQVAAEFLYIEAEREPQQGTVPTVTIAHGEAPQPAGADRKHLHVELNTENHDRADYSSLAGLEGAAKNRSLQLQLIPLEDFYDKAVSAARPGWLFWGFLGTPLLIACVELLRRLHNVRSKSSPALNSFP